MGMNDFGDLTTGHSDGGRQSKTRGLIAGGSNPDASTKLNVIDFITMSTLGNGADFD